MQLQQKETGTSLTGKRLKEMISVDAYPFLAFSDLTCHLEDVGLGFLWFHCAPSAGKNTGVVLVPYSRMEVRLLEIPFS